MITIVLLGLLACANAAPKRGGHYHHHHHHRHGHSYYNDDSNTDDYSDRNIESQMFDTRRILSNLSRQMMSLDTKLTDLSERLNRNDESPQINDKEYKIFLELQGFVEKEILIQVKKGILFVQAIRKVVDEPDREYLKMMTLPNNVGEEWSWTYKNGLLRIVFPITQVEKEIPTQKASPDQSVEWSGEVPHSEEMSNNGQDNDQNENSFETNVDLISTNMYSFKTTETPVYKITTDPDTYVLDSKVFTLR